MTHSVRKKDKKKNGYALLELLFYVAFFVTFSLIVINAMIIMTKSFRETSIQGELAQSGAILERISREIKQAYSIDPASTADDLKLNAKNDAGANKTVEFLLSGSNLQLLENSVLIGNLNAPNIIVTGLTFTQITTVKGKAIKIVLSIRSSNDSSARVQYFYDTVVLRGSY